MHCLLTAGATLKWKSAGGIEIIKSDGTFLQLTSEAGICNLSLDIQQRWQHAQKVSHRAGRTRSRLVTALVSTRSWLVTTLSVRAAG